MKKLTIYLICSLIVFTACSKGSDGNDKPVIDDATAKIANILTGHFLGKNQAPTYVDEFRELKFITLSEPEEYYDWYGNKKVAQKIAYQEHYYMEDKSLLVTDSCFVTINGYDSSVILQPFSGWPYRIAHSSFDTYTYIPVNSTSFRLKSPSADFLMQKQ